MGNRYFIEYQTDRKTKPYKLSDDVRTKLLEIEGLVIKYEAYSEPTVAVVIPDDKIKDVKSLDSIARIYKDPLFGD